MADRTVERGFQNAVREPLPGVVYPPAADLERYLDAGLLEAHSWPEALAESFRQHSERELSIAPEGTLTYAEMDALSDRAAAGLLRCGLKPLDRVIFQLHNCAELLVAFIGCLKAGLIPVCTLASHREHEIDYLARHSRARGHIVQGDDPKFDHVAFACRMKQQLPHMHAVISVRGAARADIPRLEDLIAGEEPSQARARVRAVPRDPFQVALLQLSGGTTGVPKLIPRFHNEYVYQMRSVAQFLDYRADDVMLMPMPMIHNASMSCAWGPILLVGGSFAITAHPTVESFAATLRRTQPTWIAAGQKQLLLRIREALERLGMRLEHVHGVWTINAAKFTREEMRLPGIHIFGMSEGLITFSRTSDPLELRERTVGRPISAFDRVRLLRPGTELDVAPGEIGELATKGPYTFHGYYDAPERNAVAFTSDGYYRSGDLMSAREANGATYYVFEGRIKDVVDRGGEKISCEEVEAALARMPVLADVAVIGVADERLGERTCACVTPRATADASALSVATLAAHLERLGLAKFKWPEHVEIFESLPLTNVGKIDKEALRRIVPERLRARSPGAC